MRVILAEKPDMGRQIAAALGNGRSRHGYIELSGGDVVTWAIGHIVRLKTPDAYPELKEWKYDTLPILPKPFETEVDPAKKEQFSVIAQLVGNSACNEVVIATDAGREGELIGRWILAKSGYKGPLKRLWIDDLTADTIRAGFRKLKDGKETFNLGAAAEVRARADYIIGFTASRLFTLVAREATNERITLSAGRVQTPTLRIVYDREMAIQQFKAQEYFEIRATFKTEKGEYDALWFAERNGEKVTRFETKEQAEQLRSKIEGKTGSILEYEEREVSRAAPQLFHSTSLKTAALKALGFGIEETVKIAQSLYDKGFISYTRTASRHMSENAADQLADNLAKIRSGSKYASAFPATIGSLKGKSRFVDNKKAAEHHAIVPTGQNPTDLTEKEERLYELILKHTLAAFHPEGLDKQVTVITGAAGEKFFTRGVIVLEEGWRKILKPEDEENEGEGERLKVPVLKQGDPAAAIRTETKAGKTSPPKRLSEADLEKAMENAGKIVDEMDDEEALQHLKEKGIGTPATRTAIIKNLKDMEYIESKKNLVYLTDKGRNFIGLIHETPIASIELTGEFEKKLEDVAQGKSNPMDTLKEFIQHAHDIVGQREALKASIEANMQGKPMFQKADEVIGDCPKCGKPVAVRDDFYGCTGFKDGCKFSLPKKFLKANITASVAKGLIKGGEALLQNIPGQYGPYNLIIWINQDGKIESKKPAAEDLSLGACPECGKEVLEKEKFYGCTGYKDGCKFSLPKEFLKKKLSAAQIRKLLAKGQTDVIKGLAGGKGEFDSALTYNKETRRLSFVK
ncbi:type IA DNA topoisomerase [Cohnella sp. CFH 77786]|uniref:DNA topoisomerase n=1 Tax=Cohnella sp. CFH 77786 TaxID=2662265 RepID=UPI001C60C285|nr:DNA topoisomerase [Cohnella sp. CFH 77786]MBW5449338.1 type IA DNA topoisomerase [Cohnella sp. CFH 77786]